MINYYLLYLAFSAVHLSISVLFAAISVLLSTFQHTSSLLFELVSDFYGVPPRSSFPTEKCAILILGAQEGASVTPYTAITYPPVPPLRCGKKRGALVLRVGLYRLCSMSESTRGVWTHSAVREIKRHRFGEINASWQRHISHNDITVIQSFYTYGITGKRGHDRFPGV
jgi:hypothetical protein